MDLPDLKKLGKVIDLCRKKGIARFECAGIKFELGEEPTPKLRRVIKAESTPAETTDSSNPYANFPKGILSQDELIYYSAGGMPPSDDGQEPEA
jgi:hypothetical protein